MCSLPMDMTVVFGLHKFSLQVTIDHHGPFINSGYYTNSINCCKKNILLQRQKNCGIWNEWYQKHLCCTCNILYIDYAMAFVLEQEDGSWITHIELAHPFPPIISRSRNKRRNMWVGWCVSSGRPWFWLIYSIYYVGHWNKLFLRDIYISRVCLAMTVCWIRWQYYCFLLVFNCIFQ